MPFYVPTLQVSGILLDVDCYYAPKYSKYQE